MTEFRFIFQGAELESSANKFHRFSILNSFFNFEASRGSAVAPCALPAIIAINEGGGDTPRYRNLSTYYINYTLH